MSKFARRGVGNHNRGRSLPPAPTSALPGTPEKVAILCQRARDGFSLWHPADPTLFAETGGRRKGVRRFSFSMAAGFGGAVFVHGRRVS
jgi:hypothetical protein